MSKKEIYQFFHKGKIVQELDMSDYQCSGIVYDNLKCNKIIENDREIKKPPIDRRLNL